MLIGNTKIQRKSGKKLPIVCADSKNRISVGLQLQFPSLSYNTDNAFENLLFPLYILPVFRVPETGSLSSKPFTEIILTL